MSEFAQTLPEGGTSRVENIESLQRIEWGAKKWDTTTYLIQKPDKPNQVVTLNGLHPLPILLPV